MAHPTNSLLEAFARVDDPRKPRGVRHPFRSLLALTFLGLLGRQTDLAALRRWAEDYWDCLKEPLGFTRDAPPHPTTLGRVLARFSLDQFRRAFADWLVGLLADDRAPTAAVDGKTSKQGHDADGDPIHMLNVFAHELRACLAQYPVTAGKPTEPQALAQHLGELLARYPFLRLFTGDALFAQRPLAEAIVGAGRDYLFVLKDNQPELLEAVRVGFQDLVAQPPDAETVEKKGAKCTGDGCGSSRARRSITWPRRPASRAWA